MKIEQLMTRQVVTCGPNDSLARAAQLMWEKDCGVLPVIDDSKLVGILTDRDICMAASFTGSPLGQLPVRETMTKQVHFCAPEDSFEKVAALLAAHQIHRMPVIDGAGKIAGVVSLNDLAREAQVQQDRKIKESHVKQIEETLVAVAKPRVPANMSQAKA